METEIVPTICGPYDEVVSTVGRVLSQRHQRLVPAYLAAIILGIVGMHALMQHCPTPAHAMSATSSTAAMSPLAGAHAGEHVVAAIAGPTIAGAHTSVSLVEATGQPGGSLDDMLMLCAAMLLGAGALLALLLSRRAPRPIGLPRLPPTMWRPLLILAGTGPPPTLAFTVIRC